MGAPHTITGSARRGRRPDLPLPARDRARHPRHLADRGAGRGRPRRRPVGLRQEHAHPGHQRADPARLPGRADRHASGSRAGRRRELKLRDIARTVGTVLQDPAKQIVGATVEAELAFGPENLGIPREEIRERIREVADAGRDRAAARPRDGRAVGRRAPAPRRRRDPDAAAAPVRRRRAARQPRSGDRRAPAGAPPRRWPTRAARSSSSSTASRRRSTCGPDRVLYLEEGSTRYIGAVDGFLEVADPRVGQAAVRASSLGASPARLDRGPEPPGRRRDRAPGGVDRRRVAAARVPGRRARHRSGHEILHGVDAALGPTEIVAILGPNGSGKTTLFRTAMRLLDVCRGRGPRRRPSIASGGRPTSSTTLRLRLPEPEPDAVRPDRRARSSCSGRATSGATRPASTRWSQEVLRADVPRRPRGHPRATAAGDVVRPAEAARAGHRPGPPTGDADPRRAVSRAGPPHRRCVHARGRRRSPDCESLYFVTHDVDLALTHADRILLFREGRVVADGPPMEVIADTDRWRACNLRVTSLMEANARHGSTSGSVPRRRDAGAPGRSPGSGALDTSLEGRPRQVDC